MVSTIKARAIVFDLDDTLYPEKQYVFSGFRAVAEWAERELGIPKAEGFRQLSFFFDKGVRGNTFNLFMKENNNVRESDYVLEMIKIYREHIPSLTPYPEVPEILSMLSKTYQLGIISDGYLQVQQNKWVALNLGVDFQAVIFSDLWGRDYWKPHKRPFIQALRILGTPASDTCYVGDNPEKDFLGANELGLFTVMVKRDDGVYSDVSPLTSKHAADFVVNDFSNLEMVLSTKFEKEK